MTALPYQSRSASDLAKLDVEVLYQLKRSADAAVASARADADAIDQALDHRYRQLAADARRAAGKDTGTVHLVDGDHRISVELPKRVEWDQARLAAIVERIRAAGENPGEFVEISYRVSEAKYSAWPASMRASFDSARTLKPGKPVYRLAPAQD
ncbi:hypothetical protein [Lysobacter enzymogenes]|uniref:hypothetical protein n=1 Tax=Lysobacter enzymogenes TaxID=69 RepID=UPI001AFBFB43|nr:hypothetical protein [Lysobacter enzymogenes]QQQ01002.1 hypothetical protein JHW41_23530 [Lysobacter enzymogenes]